MERKTTRAPDDPTASYASYLVRVWRPADGALPARVDIEHVQSGKRLAVDPDAFADVVARVAAGFPTGPAPPPDADRARLVTDPSPDPSTHHAERTTP